MENHKPSPDGFTGVKPVVVVSEKEMTVVWGDSKTGGGAEKAWKAIIFHRSPTAHRDFKRSVEACGKTD
jgi:hypothetical protein